MASEFTVESEYGRTIKAERWDSPDYPGITVYVDDRQVAVAECDEVSEPDALVVKVWEDDAVDWVFKQEYSDLEGMEVDDADIVVETSAGPIQVVETGEGAWVYLCGLLAVVVEIELEDVAVRAYYPGSDGLEYELVV